MLFRFPNGPDFLRDINAHRAPGDASAAAYASGSPKLVDPGGQFVGHPLTIAGFSTGTHAASVDVRMVHREAGIPSLPAFGVISFQVRDVLDRRAKTRGADHRAIGAGQTTGRNVVP